MYRIRLIGAASLAALMAATASQAADDAADPFRVAVVIAPGETIVVEGKYRAPETLGAAKTPTPTIDIPQALSVLSREQLDDQALLDIADILRYTPGASTGQGEGNRDQFTIRGQNTTADFFIDGLRDDVQYFRPLYNLERVEILKGPNALLFGRGGGGGVINRVTKSPDLDAAFAGAMASIDTFGAVNVSGDVNAPLSDNAAFRLNAFYESLDNHRDFFGGDRYAINPTALFELTPSTQINLSYEYVNDDRTVDRGVPSFNGEPLMGFDNTFFGDPDANVTTLQAHIARARLDHRFSEFLSANATFQYADYDKLYQNIYPIGIDLGANTVSLDGYRDETDRQNLIIQTNLVGEFATGPFAHTMLAGFEYGDQDSLNSRRDVLFADSNDDQINFTFSDPLAIPAFSFPAITRDRNSDVQFTSVFIQDQIELAPWLQVIGGVRYDRFKIDAVDQIEVANGDADGNDGLAARTDDVFSPRFGVVLKPMENASLYASYTRSFLPRSGDQFLNLTPSNAVLEPENFENLEAGLKWDLHERLTLTAALFQLDREGGVTVDPNNPENSIIIGSRTRGFEIQLAGEILPNWVVNTGYSYLDANQRGNVVNNALANNRLGQVPEHMFSLWNRYNLTDRFGLGLGVTYQSSQFASLSNNVELPGFVRIDAAAYYRLSDGIQLQVNVENLTDADYFPAAHNDNNISTGEPLNARFTVKASF